MVIGGDSCGQLSCLVLRDVLLLHGDVGERIGLSKMMAASAWNTLRERTHPDAPLEKGT